jgi:hypothetical protein
VTYLPGPKEFSPMIYFEAALISLLSSSGFLLAVLLWQGIRTARQIRQTYSGQLVAVADTCSYVLDTPWAQILTVVVFAATFFIVVRS